MMMFGMRITANIRKLKKICFPKIHGKFTIIRVDKNYQCVWDERECPQIIRKLKKQLFFENSRSIHGNSRSQDGNVWNANHRKLSEN